MVLAAGLAASLSVFLGVSSIVRNDSLAVAGGAVALVGTFGALANGPRPAGSRWRASGRR